MLGLEQKLVSLIKRHLKITNEIVNDPLTLITTCTYDGYIVMSHSLDLEQFYSIIKERLEDESFYAKIEEELDDAQFLSDIDSHIASLELGKHVFEDSDHILVEYRD